MYDIKWFETKYAFLYKLRFIKRELPQTILYHVKQINIEFISEIIVDHQI